MSAAANGDGPLRRKLNDACAELGCSLDALTVLSNHVDPYRADTAAFHRDGAWVGEQLVRFYSDERRTYWRGLHYAMSQDEGGVRKPNGQKYRNNDEDWNWMVGAGKAARWLGYVDPDRIFDNRNSPPVIHRKARVTPETWVSAGLNITIPDADEIEPVPRVTGFEGRQPYQAQTNSPCSWHRTTAVHAR